MLFSLSPQCGEGPEWPISIHPIAVTVGVGESAKESLIGERARGWAGRDTCAERLCRRIRCGRPGFWGCPLGLIAVRVGRPMDWNASSMIEACWMADISLPIQCCSSDTRWGGDERYPHTIRCYGFEAMISPPTPCLSQTAVRALKALREVQYHRTCNAPCAGRKPWKESRWATPPDLTVAGGIPAIQV